MCSHHDHTTDMPLFTMDLRLHSSVNHTAQWTQSGLGNNAQHTRRVTICIALLWQTWPSFWQMVQSNVIRLTLDRTLAKGKCAICWAGSLVRSRLERCRDILLARTVCVATSHPYYKTYNNLAWDQQPSLYYLQHTGSLVETGRILYHCTTTVVLPTFSVRQTLKSRRKKAVP